MIQFAWANQLRVYAALAVIALHVSAHALFNSPDLHNPEKFWIILINAATRWSVPVFVMLSGALVLPKNESFKKITTGRGAKIVILIGTWSGIYLLFSAATGTALSARSIIGTLWYGSAYYHLYFLYIIAGLYFASPLLNAILRRLNQTQEIIVIAASLGLTALYNWHDIATGAHMLHLNALTWWLSFIGYYLWGNYMIKHAPQLKSHTYATLFASMIVIIVTGTHATGNLRYFFDFLSPFVAMAAWAMFNLVRSQVRKNSLIDQLAPLTLGAYLIHPLILWIMENWWPTIYKNSSFVSVPSLFFIVATLSFSLVYYFFLVKRAISTAVKPQPYP